MIENVVDPKARRVLAAAIRRLATGRITNRDFEVLVDTVPRDDPAVAAILEEAWYWYDDLSEHRVRLTARGRTGAARCYLFLGSEFPFEYPRPGRLAHLVMILLDLPTVGLVSHLFHRRRGLYHSSPGLWPFRRQNDLDAAVLTFLSPHQPTAARAGPPCN